MIRPLGDLQQCFDFDSSPNSKTKLLILKSNFF